MMVMLLFIGMVAAAVIGVVKLILNEKNETI
jgi:hypothetical protein